MIYWNVSSLRIKPLTWSRWFDGFLLFSTQPSAITPRIRYCLHVFPLTPFHLPRDVLPFIYIETISNNSKQRMEKIFRIWYLFPDTKRLQKQHSRFLAGEVLFQHSQKTPNHLVPPLQILQLHIRQMNHLSLTSRNWCDRWYSKSNSSLWGDFSCRQTLGLPYAQTRHWSARSSTVWCRQASILSRSSTPSTSCPIFLKMKTRKVRSLWAIQGNTMKKVSLC